MGPESHDLINKEQKLKLYQSDTQTESEWNSPNIKAKTTIDKSGYSIIILANPKSGSCLAKNIISDFPKESSRLMMIDKSLVPCVMRIFDITD